MKNFLISLLLGIGLIGCNNGGFLYDAAREAAPVITAASSRTVFARDTVDWDFGNDVYEIFNTLRDYDNATDQGVVGVSNMYKTLFQTGEFYSNAEMWASSITEQAVTSPYNFATTHGTVYNYTFNRLFNNSSGTNAGAIKNDGTTKYALLTWYVENNNNEWGVIQGKYNEGTGDVDIDLICYVYYSSTSTYSMRIKLVGNTKSHLFSINLYKGGLGSSGISLSGYGYSHDAGKFLARVDNDGEVKYFLIDGDATETDLIALKDSGKSTVAEVNPPAGYEANLPTPFTDADIASSSSSFTGTGAHNIGLTAN